MAAEDRQGGVAVLTDDRVAEIRRKAEDKRSQLGFGVYAPIGAKVFSCLDRQGILILQFPVDDVGLAAFIGRRDGRNVVFINTALPRGKQHFAAAHELYHAWFDDDALSSWSSVCEIEYNGGSTLREMQANRFAAEFLVPRCGMRDYLESLPAEFDSVDQMVLLSDYYEVPVKTIVLRLEEESYISAKDKDRSLLDPAIYAERRGELGLTGTMEEATYHRSVSPVFRAVMRSNRVGGRISSGKLEGLLDLLNSMPSDPNEGGSSPVSVGGTVHGGSRLCG